MNQESNTLAIPHSELINHGCRNCVWRLHAQCPHNIKENEVYVLQKVPMEIKGYCKEFSDFLVTFAENEDSISAVWEKLSIYTSKLQALEDYRTFKELEQDIKRLEKEGKTDPKRLKYLQERKDRLKTWWARLNEEVIKSLKNVVDREKKIMNERKAQVGYFDPKKVNFTPKIENKK